MKFPEGMSEEHMIWLLQRWILVQSFIYYELNENLATDYQYDENVKMLFALKKQHPTSWLFSPYNDIFCNYEEGCTSGFELLERTKKINPALYRYIWMDAVIALDVKEKNK